MPRRLAKRFHNGEPKWRTRKQRKRRGHARESRLAKRSQND